MHPSESFRETWRARSAAALISVHRGLWGPAPENSRAGIREGSAIGIVEIDVQLAADGVPVVMHDTSLVRMTGLDRVAGEVSSQEISTLTLRQGLGGPEAGLSTETVPTLAEAIDSAPAETFFDFDVKHSAEIEDVARFLAENGYADRGSLKIDVRSESDIHALRTLEDQFGLMVMAKPVLSKDTLPLISALAEEGVAASEVWFDDLGILAEACARAGDRMAISTYTLDPVHCCGLADNGALKDPDAVWGKLLDAGVTVLMTDQARALQSFLSASGPQTGGSAHCS